MAKPVLKWAGGKRQLLDELYARFPASFGRYHEPFLGGGAVFFDLAPAAATVNDTNPRLVNFYEQVRDRPEALIDEDITLADRNVAPGMFAPDGVLPRTGPRDRRSASAARLHRS